MQEFYSTFGFQGLGLGLCSLCCKQPRPVLVRNRHLLHPIRLRLKTSDVLVYKLIFGEGEYDFDLAKPPHTIIDAGANIGIATAIFASRFPDAHIIAVEPEPDNYKLLTENAAPYPHVTTLRAALWKEAGTISLYAGGRGSCSFNVTSAVRSDKAVGTTASVTMAQLMETYAMPSIDILKLDIEGAEREVLQNCGAWIDTVQRVIIETHDRILPGCSDATSAALRAFAYDGARGENHYYSRGADFRLVA